MLIDTTHLTTKQKKELREFLSLKGIPFASKDSNLLKRKEQLLEELSQTNKELNKEHQLKLQLVAQAAIPSEWLGIEPLSFEFNGSLKENVSDENPFNDISLVTCNNHPNSEEIEHLLCRIAEEAPLSYIPSGFEEGKVHFVSENRSITHLF